MRKRKLTEEQKNRFYRISACVGGAKAAVSVGGEYGKLQALKYLDEIYELNKQLHMEIEYGTRTNT